MGLKPSKSWRLRLAELSILLFATTGFAQTFTGTNTAGTGTNFSFAIAANVTNIALTLPGTAAGHSRLYVRRASAATESVYDFSSQIVNQTNTIYLEQPELVAATWFARVSTPAGAPTHNFSLTLQTNVTGLRTTNAVDKPVNFTTSGSVAAGAWNYFRIEVPTNSSVKIALESPVIAPDLYVQRSQLPTTAAYLKRSQNTTNDLIHLAETELTEGYYYIGVFGNAAGSYTLRSESISVIPLEWDPGDTHAGTLVYSNQVEVDTELYFKIRTQSPGNTVWRTALKVTDGPEAHLYLSRNTIPSPLLSDFKSERIGSDGLVLTTASGPQFTEGQDWYIAVHAKAGAQFKLVSGTAYVLNLGTLATDDSSSTNVVMGPEGYRFFQTTVPAGTLAWRLWVTNATNSNIYLRTAGAPLSNTANWTGNATQPNQTLVVPPYLAANQLYFIAIPGTNGQSIALDSRQQTITDIPYSVGVNEAPFTTNLTVSGYNYVTFRVSVPENQAAWQINVTPTTGNPNLFLRRTLVGNENYTDGFSEVGGLIADSVTMVPPGLTDGTFYLTIHNASTNVTNSTSFTLRSGPATITDIDYVQTITNDETNRVGWRYYRAKEISQQLSTLGWDLFLTNFAPGTRIAVRQTKAPSIRNHRNPNGTANDYDRLGTDFLQQPNHQADTWYIGIYNPTNALGAFTLVARELTATQVTSPNEIFTRTNLPSGKWDYYKINLDPATFGGGPGANEIFGWDFRLTNVTGLPRLFIRREGFPTFTAPTAPGLGNPGAVTNWPGGQQWNINLDWTRRQYANNGTNDESGRVLALGLGRPYEPGTYYVGIINTSGTNEMSYSLMSRAVGYNRPIPMTNLGFDTNTPPIVNTNLAPREAAYYRVTLPSGQRSWKVRLQVNAGEAMMVVSTNKVPNIESEKRMQKTGNEIYTLLPRPGQSTLPAGDYYVAVIGEGHNSGQNKIGTNVCSYSIQGLGQMPEITMPEAVTQLPTGVLNTSRDLLITNQFLEGGDSIAYHFELDPFWAENNFRYDLILEDPSGEGEQGFTEGFPVVLLRGSDALIYPGLGPNGFPSDDYGNEGGETSSTTASAFGINVSVHGTPASISSARYTVVVKARALGGVHDNARYSLRVRQIVHTPIAFESATVVTNQPDGEWKYFRLDVPSDSQGWDIRLTNVVGCFPDMVVARDAFPLTLTTGPSFDGKGTTWPDGASWAPFKDWTARGNANNGMDETGRLLAMGMGRPLQGGVYFVGVFMSLANSNSSYTLLTRGMGPAYEIPVTPIDFAGGQSSGLLEPREAAYFRVDVPTNVPSWKVKLQCTGTNEAMLIALKATVPNILAANNSSVLGSPGRAMQKLNNEHFVLLPPGGQSNIASGIYYLAVVSEGGNPTNINAIGKGVSAYTITSIGTMPTNQLGTIGLSPTITNATLEGGEVMAYEFTVPTGLDVLEAQMTNTVKVGNPIMVLRRGPRLPEPGMGGPNIGAESYGNEGGETSEALVNATSISVTNPVAGIYSLLIKARSVGSTFSNASFTLQVKGYTNAPIQNSIVPLLVDGPLVVVTNHSSNSWRYYQLEVPTNANLLGLDIRLTNINAGLPKLIMRRDVLPVTTVNIGWPGNAPGSASSWTTSNQWAANAEWSRRHKSADNLIDESGRILAMGMGRPLQPGTYFIGVTNNTTNAWSYSVSCRGIGDGFTIPIVELPFAGGSATNLALAPRDASYYRVVVPDGAVSWKMKVTGISGECMFVCLSNLVPNVEANAEGNSISVGRSAKKPGNEFYLQLPTAPRTGLLPSTNYFAVVSEGGSPLADDRIGVGLSAFSIRSEGELPVLDFGNLSSQDNVIEEEDLGGGEVRAYQFTVPPGSRGVKVKLENRVGNPVMTMRPGTSLPDPSSGAEAYGTEGGYSAVNVHATSITVPDATPGVYSLAVKARKSGNFLDADYRLRISEILTPELNFDASQNTNGLSNVTPATSLEDNERVFYAVNVPATLNGNPVLGWKLELQQTSGSASVRVRRGALSSDSPVTGTAFTTQAAYIVPPYLTNDIWYVEVKGAGPTTFTLTSSALTLERPSWIMPGLGTNTTAPGLALPEFGDSGVETNGADLPGDQSINLNQGYSHYYGVVVPPENAGLMRVALEVISGNPDLYMRMGTAPTISHNTSGGGGSIYDRLMTASVTEYANWVPFNGKSETRLPPGTWFFAVRAVGTSAKYRLKLSTGKILDLAITNSTHVTNVLNGDWFYYRVQTPAEIPLGWRVNYTVQSGDVRMYIRDTVPPGQAAHITDYKDWSTDGKHNGFSFPTALTANTHNFATPPTRPGHTYYIGFRGQAQSSFTVNISTNGAPVSAPPTLDFYGGSIQNLELAPNSQVTYRIDVPADATRWKHSSVHSTNIQLFIEQGTIPSRNGNDDWRSSGTNSTWNAYLLNALPNAWPLVPGQSYYLTASNTVTAPFTFSFFMDGRNAQSDDDDNDGMLDSWERFYFNGGLNQNATGDFDADGVNNLNEFLENTHPATNNSFLPRLITGATNGSISRFPDDTKYPMNSVVTLTATPNAGYAFVNWTSSATGATNPLPLLMNGHKTVYGLFKLIGDDFSIRLPITGLFATKTGTSVGTTKEPGEPNHAGNAGGRSIWWTWTAPVSGQTTIDTAGSSFNTLLGIYTGNVVSNLTLVTNNATLGTNKARVVFNSVAGQEYQIAVDGANAASGNVNLTLSVAGYSQMTSPVRLGNGSLQFTLQGAANATYTLMTSSNLVQWDVLNSVTTGGNGTVIVTDPNTSQKARYYRIRFP